MRRWWMCRPTLSCRNSVRGKSKDSGSASQGNSFTMPCPAPGNISTSSAISDASSPRQLLVLHAVRDDAVLAEPAHLVFLLVLGVAFEPFDMSDALEGK